MAHISHHKFRRYIQAALHNRLGIQDQRLLSEHIAACAECRAYAEDVQVLEKDLRRVLHARLDAFPGSSLEMPEDIQGYSRNRTSSKPAFGFVSALALVAVMGILILAINRALPRQNLVAGVGTAGPALPTTQPPSVTLPAVASKAITATVPTVLTQEITPATSTQSVALPWRTEPVTYTVQPGDTVLSIAQKYGLRPESIYWANIRLFEENGNRLTPRLVLWIPPYDGMVYEWGANEGQGKDDLNKVAAMFGVQPEDIINWPGNDLDAEAFAGGSQPEFPEGTALFVPGARGGVSRAISWSVLGISRAAPEPGKDLGPGYCQRPLDGTSGDGNFIWPSSEPEIFEFSRSWGDAPTGLDLSVKPGDQAYAADGGVVVYAGQVDTLPGGTVIIDHGNSWLTLYSGLDKPLVKCGDSINQGSPLGTVVSTKSSSGTLSSSPLLHFELAEGGNIPVNPLHYLPAHEQDFSASFAWSPNGDLLAVGSQTGLRLYDLASFQLKATLLDNTSCNGPIVFKDRLLSAINGEWLRVWDPSTRQLLFSIEEQDPINFQSLAISPDQQLIATGEQKRIRLWTADGDLFATIPVEGFISNLAFTPDGKRLVAAVQWQALLVEWDLKSLELVQSVEIPEDVFSFTISPDATTMLVDYRQPGLELWDLSVFASRRYYDKIIGASGFTRIAPDNTLVAVWGYNASNGNAAAIWDLQDETLVREFTRGGRSLNSEWKSMEFSPDGETIAISDDQGTIHFYEISTGKETGSIFLEYRYKQ